MMQLPFPLAAPEPSQIESGRRMFAQGAEFLKGVVAMSGLPPDDRVEVCFAGRSNVGKSSLINAITNRKALARASNTPGRTQEINFFTLADRYLVDLPGYGFAEAPKVVVEKWQALLKRYLQGRANLRRAFVLIDSRHGVKPVDDEILGLLDKAAVPFQVVLTKADKIKVSEHPALLAQVRAALQKHPAAYPEMILTSSEKGDGIDVLRAAIAAID
ncbi:ribosome biogenesis GTP-binding protein YihA/YsxC [Frigidibacter sp. ROC022]|uniref:ribosome biogenesis GTP-binding protein YihA/YsxC n=1 Tax=Frigidibacter sp. ROC022 TaxID=2971796 RepID=UPI00215A4ABF|nr:ribosome biogenesis GTP-binding protein YihA/YsxC [Frigidibacter sp. ROC022]MCR8725917.1 ribosome biogenesis GTP-binding protein YihA/YsxC [Frigidibacter sp. ROC022]